MKEENYKSLEALESRTLRNKGITIVSLVVTIIVILILAGVTIGTLMGENGVINQAQRTSETEQQKQANAQLQINDLETKLATSEDTLTLSRSELNSLISEIVAQKVEKMTSDLNSQMTETISQEVETKTSDLKNQVDVLNNQGSMHNVRSYIMGGTKFDDISLETGDYLCFLFTYGQGTAIKKPSIYFISLGANTEAYLARCLNIMEEDSFTLDVSPRTESNPNGLLSINTPYDSWFQCTLIKIDNGHT